LNSQSSQLKVSAPSIVQMNFLPALAVAARLSGRRPAWPGSLRMVRLLYGLSETHVWMLADSSAEG
jgi:hypothetical protein